MQVARKLVRFFSPMTPPIIVQEIKVPGPQVITQGLAVNKIKKTKVQGEVWAALENFKASKENRSNPKYKL